MSQASTLRSDVPAAFAAANANPSRLVHLIPDELARTVPDHSLFAYPKTDMPADGFVEVSAKCFANGINRVAWYLESVLGKAPEGTFPAVGYIGHSDIRYFLFMFGAIKAGYKMLYLSPRNSVAGHLNVLEKSDCNIFLSAKNAHVEHITSQRNMRTAIVPELDELLDNAEVRMYPYNKSFAEARTDPCLVLHTTGSTGLPKPITWKNEILSTYEAWRTIPAVDGYVPTTEIYQQSRRAYNQMPLFHTSGLNIGITMSLLLGVTTVYGSANVVPHAAYADEIHKHAGVDASIGPPSSYQELSQDPKALERIHNFHYILVCGAAISQTAGDIISKHCRVISNFGATETACLPRLAPSVEDWAYFYWHPTHSGIVFREYMDGLHELFIVRKPELDLYYQGIFSTFPHLEEYSMNDVYQRHPDPAKPFLYKWTGRADDVIVLSNGEKLAPALMEASLMSSSLVKGAMVVGRGKFQPAALVDLKDAPPMSARDRHALIKEMAPAIAQANKHAPAHGQLDQYHILFVDPSRPMHYLGQGKIQRHQTYRLYEQDIEEVYAAAESLDDEEGNNVSKVDFGDKSSIKKWLAEIVAEIAEIENIGADDAFFEAGMDSLHVIKMVRELKIQAKIGGGKHLTPDSLSPTVVYSNPSLNDLTDFLFKQADLAPEDPDSAYQSADPNEKQEDPKMKYMESLLDKFVQSLPIQTETRPTPVTEGTTVLLTGSTGSLGSYLLNELNNDPNVNHIICLDRSANGAEKQRESAPIRGLTTVDSKRVTFFKADLGAHQLGLNDEDYARLVNEVTHVIHCQWPVNFNWTIQSFKPYIAGVRNLAQLAAASANNAFVLFVSSIAAVGGWKGAGPVPEAPIHDLTAAAPLGYGQSKLISEIILDKAAEISGVRTAVCRVGIVAGPVETQLGMWNKHEYIPSIIVSSAHLGVFPETFPSRDHIDWLPVDKLSKVLVEILGSASTPSAEETLSGSRRSKTFHVVNPKASSWEADLAADMIASYPAGMVKPVPFEDWVERLRESLEEAEKNGNVDAEVNPAIRLLEFYTKAAAGGNAEKKNRTLPTDISSATSKTLGALGPLNRAWMENWMVQWGIKAPVAAPQHAFLALN
ncbi:L-aminoadipate-semialdehyde dehydrogenase protein [Rutstroemia sp. NJR-2017a BBW]|nr:L-aminoadipate-semialdehyde dehydrogenase protein [Rutstroemia sp. NJR-2017a BBW]